MGPFRLVRYVLVTVSAAFLVLNYSTWLLDIEPREYSIKLLTSEGPLAVNTDLNDAEILFKDKLVGAECLEFQNGEMYASLVDGRIVAIKDNKEVRVIADTSEGSPVPARPLGMRFYKDDLYVVDTRGLLKVDIKTGKIDTLISTSEEIDGIRVNFPDDLDIKDGDIYFSDMSAKWNLHNLVYGFLEHDNSGRVYKYNIKSREKQVVLRGLVFPNGVQLTHDKGSLLIAEVFEHRILRHYLTGPKKGQTEVFAQLPGEPDNIRPSSRGGYWVAMFSGRDVSAPSLADRLAPYPKLRKVLGRLTHTLGTGLEKVNEYVKSELVTSIAKQLKDGMFLMALFNVEHSVVVELNAEGKIIRSLHSSNISYALNSHAVDYDGNLYVGSFARPGILKLKL